jgi:hypothetical protein
MRITSLTVVGWRSLRGEGDLVVNGAFVEAREQPLGFWRHDRAFVVVAGESADGVERVPESEDEEVNHAACITSEDVTARVAGKLA